MGAFLTAFLVSVGAGVWIFTKLQQRTGYGNNKNAIIGAVSATIAIFVVAYITFRLIGL